MIENKKISESIQAQCSALDKSKYGTKFFDFPQSCLQTCLPTTKEIQNRYSDVKILVAGNNFNKIGNVIELNKLAKLAKVQVIDTGEIKDFALEHICLFKK